MNELVLQADLTGDLSPDGLWQAALRALAADATSVRIEGPRDSLVLWDTETLGSPRPALLGPDPRADLATGLAWIAEHEPHTWALVQEERYAVGPLASYLLARATRGLLHLTDDADRCSARAAELGVPPEVLPGLVPSGRVGTTDPSVCRGLSLPVVL